MPIRVVAAMRFARTAASNPVTSAPIVMTGMERASKSSGDSDTARKMPMTPGVAADPMTSDSRDCLRKYRNTPIAPAQAPMRVVPMMMRW